MTDRIEDGFRDFEPLEEQLRAERPQLTPLELDRVKLRALTGARRGGLLSRKEAFVKSRLAITFMLVLGFVFSTTGAGLALSGISDQGSASQVEYPQQLGEQEEGGEEGEEQAEELGVADEEEPDAAEEAQPTRQVEAADDDGLPFTGLAAIPLMVAGAGLLVTGFTLRRRTR